ncbi:DsrE family protein [Sansalvadorimonas sp. 2012CJ34-2]|uniref:DsrE family protein n=1 Tax=Parendozoicomonas callyspongiae TaxID=2942213 RepID=A0ABT0PGP4_9GAMM|nr:DsrE family protein [Sansalvadorimonas sp. 2012CJ34-2]MCL6270518.1 DsrE family protein [Sansalvadorimonas sp. 2012CJ34-2]
MSISLTFALMDAPYESSRTVTALRLIDIAARRGYDLKIFAYEGAVALAYKDQAAHANIVHKHDIEEENHPLPHKWIESLHETAVQHKGSIEWVNCDICGDERGIDNYVECTRGGTHVDFWQFVSSTDNTLVIGTTTT